MPKLKRILLGTMGAFLLMALPLAHAQNGPGFDAPSPNGHPEAHFKEIFNQLNLTDAQKQQLEVNKQQHRALMDRARKEMRISREALKSELMKPQLDMPKITRIHDRIKALLGQMEDDKLNSILAVRSILTTEQFLKFSALMHRHQEKHNGEAVDHQEHE